LKWIYERLEGKGRAVDTPVGRVPDRDGLDLEGLNLAPGALDELLRVDVKEWSDEVSLIREHFEAFADRLSPEMWEELERMKERLEGAE
jgi:phosphoenolpyruvate carboxykinase (GTP)